MPVPVPILGLSSEKLHWGLELEAMQASLPFLSDSIHKATA